METKFKLYRCTIDKDVSDGLETELEFDPSTGKVTSITETAVNCISGYVKREELKQFDQSVIPEMEKFTAVVERLHGYKLEVAYLDNPNRVGTEALNDYYLHLKQVGCYQLAAFLDGKAQLHEVYLNAYDPSGEQVLKRYDSDGNYILSLEEEAIISALVKVVKKSREVVIDAMSPGYGKSYYLPTSSPEQQKLLSEDEGLKIAKVSVSYPSNTTYFRWD